MILKLKQRIADLESQLTDVKARLGKGQVAPSAEEIIEVEFEIHLQSKLSLSANRWNRKQMIKRISVPVSWPTLFAPLGIKLKKPRERSDVVMLLKQAALDHSGLNANDMTSQEFELKSIRLNKRFSDGIIDRLIADKLIQEIQTSKYERYVSKKVHKFRLTSKGLHYASALRVGETTNNREMGQTESECDN